VEIHGGEAVNSTGTTAQYTVVYEDGRAVSRYCQHSGKLLVVDDDPWLFICAECGKGFWAERWAW
jgi:hypothetical protein